MLLLSETRHQTVLFSFSFFVRFQMVTAAGFIRFILGAALFFLVVVSEKCQLEKLICTPPRSSAPSPSTSAL